MSLNSHRIRDGEKDVSNNVHCEMMISYRLSLGWYEKERTLAQFLPRDCLGIITNFKSL